VDLAVIIVNWNTRELLERCLHSIEVQKQMLEVEIFVVDNASRDGSTTMVKQRFPKVRVIQSGGNLGFARANNMALPYIRAPLVLFLNPDTEVRPHTLERMVDCMRIHPEFGALGCKILDAEARVQQLGFQRFPTPFTELLKFLVVSEWTLRRFRRFLPYHDPEVSGHVSKLFGACLLVRKDVLDKVGSFDERYFMYCEDVDLCRRIVSAGRKLYYLAEAEILHVGASSSSKAPGAFAVLMTCESFGKLMKKHYGMFGVWAYRALALLGALCRLLALVLLSVARRLGLVRAAPDARDSFRKYLMISKWSLGLLHPTIRQ
jgi:GT2 family glycosyltransferase